MFLRFCYACGNDAGAFHRVRSEAAHLEVTFERMGGQLDSGASLDVPGSKGKPDMVMAGEEIQQGPYTGKNVAWIFLQRSFQVYQVLLYQIGIGDLRDVDSSSFQNFFEDQEIGFS